MQILPNIPTGTLRIHKSLQELNENDPKFFSDVVMSKGTDETNTVECEKSDGTFVENSPCLNHILYQNSHIPHRKTVSSGSCYSLSELHASKKDSDSHENRIPPFENEKNDKLQTNNIENNKKFRHTKREHNSERNNEFVSNCENSHPSYSPHCGVVGNKIPAIEIPESPEEEDHLLQQEMKNWEPLIRDGTSYRTGGGGGDIRRYNYTDSEGNTLRIITSQCNRCYKSFNDSLRLLSAYCYLDY